MAELPAVHEGHKLLVGAPLKVGDVMIYDTQRRKKNPTPLRKRERWWRWDGFWMFLDWGNMFFFLKMNLVECIFLLRERMEILLG